MGQEVKSDCFSDRLLSCGESLPFQAIGRDDTGYTPTQLPSLLHTRCLSSDVSNGQVPWCPSRLWRRLALMRSVLYYESQYNSGRLGCIWVGTTPSVVHVMRSCAIWICSKYSTSGAREDDPHQAASVYKQFPTICCASPVQMPTYSRRAHRIQRQTVRTPSCGVRFRPGSPTCPN